MFGQEDARWCDVCGGVGHVSAAYAGRPGNSPGVSNVTAFASLLLVLVVVATPVVALVVVLDWFQALAAPLRSVFEALPDGLGITTATSDGSPVLVGALAAGLALAVVVTLGVLLGRAVRATTTPADVWRARGWGLLLALAVVATPPFVVAVVMVGLGRDLEVADLSPTMTGPVPIALVAVVVLAFAWLWTGRRYVVAARRAERAAARDARRAAVGHAPHPG